MARAFGVVVAAVLGVACQAGEGDAVDATDAEAVDAEVADVALDPDAGDTSTASDSGSSEVADASAPDAADAAPAVVFPGATWATRTPAAVGLKAAPLDAFASRVGGVGCIVRDGYMVKTWGDPASKADWASAAKPVTSTLLLFAVKEGKLPSVDARVSSSGWAMSTADQAMTFRQLANMMSGYARAEAPGVAWAYNDYAISLYTKTLFERVFAEGSPNAAATHAKRLGALQLEDGSLYSSRGGSGLSTSVRDFARIGWFWLNRGSWNGVQLLPASDFDNFVKPGVPGATPRTTAADADYLGVGTYGGGSDQFAFGPGIYGFNWWFNAPVGTGSARTWPDAPPDTFQANGHWDKEVVTVIPSLRMVVAARGNWGSFVPGSAAAGMNQNLKLLVDAASP